MSDTMTMWEQLVTIVGGGGILLGAIAFLFRSLTKHLLDRDFAAHQAKLEAAHAGDLERTKAGLHKDLIAHEIRYRNVHEKIAETIAETYSHLVSLQRAVGNYVAELSHSGESIEEKYERVCEADRSFTDYFFARKIYLPLYLCEQVASLHGTLRDVTRTMTFGVKYQERRPNSDDWGKAFDAFQKKAQPLFDELRLAFHKILSGEVVETLQKPEIEGQGDVTE